DGIRDKLVTGVQTCALPICAASGTAGGLAKAVLAPCGPDAAALARAEAPDEPGRARGRGTAAALGLPDADFFSLDLADAAFFARSEERRVGKEGRARWW